MDTGSFQELRVCFVEYMRVDIPHTCASSHVVNSKIPCWTMRNVDFQLQVVERKVKGVKFKRSHEVKPSTAEILHPK